MEPNAAQNARIHIATYQTLGLDDDENLASILTEHYGDDAFSVLIIDERAREACSNSGQVVSDHIEDILTMVDIGSGARRQVEDFRLSRYACYLIVQNGDPS